LVSIRPEPDGTSAADTAVEVEMAVTEPDAFVRLLVDGTDVTDTAAEPDGDLYYPVATPGRHTVTVERVMPSTDDGVPVTTDSYTWSFETP
jgi:hypothetical protein